MRRVVVWLGVLALTSVGCRGPRPPAPVAPAPPPAEISSVVPAPADTAAIRGVVLLDGLRSDRVTLTLSVPDDVVVPAAQDRPAPRSLPVGDDGAFADTGLLAVRQVLTVQAKGRLEQCIPVVLEPGRTLDVGRVVLEVPLQVTLRYRTSPSPPFDTAVTHEVVLTNGQEWIPDGYARSLWAVKVVQADGILKFRSFFEPIALYDLGRGTLESHAGTTGGGRPVGMMPASRSEAIRSTVYLLDHGAAERWVLMEARVSKWTGRTTDEQAPRARRNPTVAAAAQPVSVPILTGLRGKYFGISDPLYDEARYAHMTGEIALAVEKFNALVAKYGKDDFVGQAARAHLWQLDHVSRPAAALGAATWTAAHPDPLADRLAAIAFVSDPSRDDWILHNLEAIHRRYRQKLAVAAVVFHSPRRAADIPASAWGVAFPIGNQLPGNAVSRAYGVTVSGTIMLVRRGEIVWSGMPAEFSGHAVDAALRAGVRSRGVARHP
jgi:hypothetical protein